MIFSVYNYDSGRYRYYEGLGGTPATGFFRKATQTPAKGGHVPEAFAVPLPAGAKLVGEGPLPRGYIAQDPSGLSAAPVPGEAGSVPPSRSAPWWMLALVAAAAFVAGRASRRSP